MKDNNVVALHAPSGDALRDLLKEGSRQLLAQAIEAELAELLGQYAEQEVDGKQAVVRNGCSKSFCELREALPGEIWEGNGLPGERQRVDVGFL